MAEGKKAQERVCGGYTCVWCVVCTRMWCVVCGVYTHVWGVCDMCMYMWCVVCVHIEVLCLCVVCVHVCVMCDV